MYPTERHQVSPDLGWIDLWCDRCGDNVPHDFVIVTDNRVEKKRGEYRDTNAVVQIEAECAAGHRQSIL